MSIIYKQQHKVFYNNHEIKFQIIKSTRRRKTSIILIKHGSVLVKTSIFQSLDDIEALVLRKATWILPRLNSDNFFSQPASIKTPTYGNGSTLPYMGKNINLEIIKNKNNELLKLEDDKFIAYTHRKKVKHLYEEWLFVTAFKIFEPIIKKYSNLLKVIPNKVLIKKLKSRWGSATYKNTINLNVNLIKAPYDVIEYVILHEICHLIERNHSHSFWKLVSKYMADYKNKIGWLKINGSIILK